MTGFIGVGQLRYILTNLGEKMTDEEVDELLKAVDTSGNGEVNYTGKFISALRLLPPFYSHRYPMVKKRFRELSNGTMELTRSYRSGPHNPRQLDTTKHHTASTIMRSKKIRI